MAIGSMTKKVRVIVLTVSFIMKGNVTIPASMRFSDTVNKFLKDLQFLALTEVEIQDLVTKCTLESKPFMLINKENIIAIAPLEQA